jgi:hypothetical protein
MRQVIITDTTTIRDQTDADVEIARGGVLTHHGQVNGTITVHPGGRLEQHGHVAGDVYGYGSVTVRGQVDGEVKAFDGSDVVILEGVRVGGRWYVASDGTFREIPSVEDFTTSAGPSRWRLHPDGTLSPA